MIQRALKAIYYGTSYIFHKSFLHSNKQDHILFEAIEHLGGIYVKLIQFLSLRSKAFSHEQKQKFLSFYDNVPFEYMDIHEILKKELTPKKLTYVRHVDDTPFASGTFGQVYHATLITNEDVVIKIKRENIKQKLTIDFFMLTVLSRLYTLIYNPKTIHINSLVDEFITLTNQELDYRLEAKNAQFFYNLYRNHPHIHIPKTYTHLSTSRILIQEYVGGIALTDIIRKRFNTTYHTYKNWLQNTYQTDMKFVLKNLAYELGIQAFKYSKFYADPHPGNIKILKNNTYAIIDFGIIGNASKNKRHYYNLLKTVITKVDKLDMAKLGKHMLMWSAQDFYQKLKTLDYHFFEKNEFITTILNTYSSRLHQKKEELRQIEIEKQEDFSHMFYTVIQAGEKFNVKIPTGLLSQMRASAIYKSWCTLLEPDFHHMRETYKDVIDTISYTSLVNEDEMNKQAIPVETALETIIDWMGTIAEIDMPLYNTLEKHIGKLNA